MRERRGPVHCLVVERVARPDPRSAALLDNARALGFAGLTDARVQDLYFVQGHLTPAERDRLARELLADPVSEACHWRNGSTAQGSVVEIALRPGVTDPVAEQVVRAAALAGFAGPLRAASGRRYVLEGELSQQDLHALARALLCNAVVERYALGALEPEFPRPATASGLVEVVAVCNLDDGALEALSRRRRAALDLAEMRAVRDHFQRQGRDPTDVEFETLAQTWSEHCVHKTFKARVTVDEDGRESVVDGLLQQYIIEATVRAGKAWVRSAFQDNAGVIEFDGEFDVAFKVETHNHPSAIEPFGGANTGVGGVVRDILGVSARPIANTDVLCFGPADLPPSELPPGVLHPRRVRAGVVAGVQDYGNKMGIPTVNGAVLYDEGFTANPLVLCGCAGLLPRGSHPRRPRVGDRIVVVGGRTGRDGLRGATFSSMTMDAHTGQVAGASVQIGDPVVERGVQELVLRARDAKLYGAITDCGAGGLSSAVGEMASSLGGEVELSRVPLKYAGLAPWEVWLSEAQERMVLAVPDVAPLRELAELWGVEVTDIGEFTGTGRLVVRWEGRVVLDLDNGFLHGGIPRRHLRAVIRHGPVVMSTRLPESLAACGELLARLLAHPDVASKEPVIRVFDHEVQGGTVVKPLVGEESGGPSDACVLRPTVTKGKRGLALSCAVNPQLGKRDAYRMALSVVDEAVRNAVAVGADPGHLALLDNFCFGDPRRESTLGDLVLAARGCRDGALHHGVPFISGKDSLNNEFTGSDGKRHAIPPVLLISAISIVPDVGRAVTMDLKEDGNPVYLLGDTRDELGGSLLHRLLGTEAEGLVPGLAEAAPAVNRRLHDGMMRGYVRACHDLSEGGLGVAAAEMCVAGRLGMELALTGWLPAAVALFSESNGRYLVEVRRDDAPAWELLMAELPCVKVGAVTAWPELRLMAAGQSWRVAVAQLARAWLGREAAR